MKMLFNCFDVYYLYLIIFQWNHVGSVFITGHNVALKGTECLLFTQFPDFFKLDKW